MTLATLLTARSATAAESSSAAAQVELTAMFPPEAWGIEIDINEYTTENIKNLWNNELRKPVRRILEANSKSSTDFENWLGDIQFVNISIYSKTLFERHRSNAGWRITLFSIPRAEVIVAAISSHYQNAQNHKKLGEASSLLFAVIEDSIDASIVPSFSGRQVSASDWDHDGLMLAPISNVAGTNISPNVLWLKDIRTTTVKKTLASFITLAAIPADPAATFGTVLSSRVLELKQLAEHLLAGVYPYSTLEDFENFRSLALQDKVAARSRLLLRSSSSARATMRIYYGPPGTGKTLAAVRFAVSLADSKFQSGGDAQNDFNRFNELNEQCAFVTFHPSLQYEDLVESIRPAINDEAFDSSTSSKLQIDVDGESIATLSATGRSLSYRLHEGPLLRLIRRALLDPSKEFVMVIDEINRGDISRILGPLISSLDTDKRLGGKFPIGVELMYPRAAEVESRLFLPSNLHVVGTMNSADRNIALVDHALRRRFEFVETPPNSDLLAGTESSLTIDRRRLLSTINGRIEHLLDADHCIGHGYLMGCNTDDEVVASFAKNIIPLLREYFYGNEGLISLILSETIDGAPKIFTTGTAISDFASAFGIEQDTAVDYGYRAGTGARVLRFDERFWKTDELVARPGNPAYAASCLRKIYQWPESSTTSPTPLPAETPTTPPN